MGEKGESGGKRQGEVRKREKRVRELERGKNGKRREGRGIAERKSAEGGRRVGGAVVGEKRKERQSGAGR